MRTSTLFRMAVFIFTLAMTANAQPARTKAVTIDELFRGFVKELPAPVTLSEQNGMGMAECDGKPAPTYNLLRATAEKLPVKGDADVLSLVPWARHKNPCIRQIAIEALITKIGFDRNQLSAPGMHELEGHHFHDIMVSTKHFLDARKVTIPPEVFAGLQVAPTEKDFASLLRGSWVEEVDGKGFQDFVEIAEAELSVTSKHLPADAAHPDHTWTTGIAAVTVNERGQFVVTGAWAVESNSTGYRGKRTEPSPFVSRFWPVAPGVVWFKNGEHAYWEKLRQRPPPARR